MLLNSISIIREKERYRVKQKSGLEDNVYTLCDSEVVSTDCHHASVVCDSNDWPVGPIPGLAAGFPVRNHLAQVGLCFRALDYPLLVRSSYAAVVFMAGAEECPA